MNLIRAYLVDLKYSLEDRVVVNLYCRTEEGRLIILKDYYRPHFLVLPKHHTELVSLRNKIGRLTFDSQGTVTSTATTEKVVNCKKEQFIKVYTSKPETISFVKQTVSKWDSVAAVFEDNISLTRKYLLEQGLVPFSLFEAEVVEKDSEHLPVYKLVSFQTQDITFMEPKTLSIHLEFASEKQLTSISYASTSFKETISWKEKKGSRLIGSEEELILDCKEKLQLLRPDLLLFDSFGLGTLLKKAEQYGITFSVNFDGTTPFYTKNKRLRTVGLQGIQLKKAVEQLVDPLIAQQKLTISKEQLQHASDLADTAELNLLLFNSLFTNFTEILKLVGLRAGDVLNFPIKKIIEWMIVKESIKINHVVLPYEHDVHHIDPYKPVIDPVPGIYDSIGKIALDQLYPSLIIEHNLSPDSVYCSPTDDFSKGLLPTLLADIKERLFRIETALSKEKNDNLLRRKHILEKVLVNFYNYLIDSDSLWYSPELVKKLNNLAKEKINSIIKIINSQNSVVYSDFNELYISMKQSPEEILQEVYHKLPDCSWLTIEKQFKRGFFLPRGETKKKQLALLDYSGLTTSENLVRFNLPKALADFIHHIIKQILLTKSTSEITSEIQQFLEELREHTIPASDLVLKTRIIKDKQEYPEKSTQYTLISALEKKGLAVKRFMLIPYVVAQVDAPISKRARLPEDLDLPYDADYYINKLLLPQLEDIVALKGIQLGEIKEPKEQSSLDSFFS